MSQFLQPSIILLRKSTDGVQGVQHIIGNIDACTVIVDTLKTTLGPCGRDKFMVDMGNPLKPTVTITNDGATVMRLLHIEHPAARCLVDVSNAQDAQVGDGTTTAVVLAGAVLRELKPQLTDGVHPGLIARALHVAWRVIDARLKQLTIKLDEMPDPGEGAGPGAADGSAEADCAGADGETPAAPVTNGKTPAGAEEGVSGFRRARDVYAVTPAMLRRLRACAETSLNSKQIAPYRRVFSRLVVNAVLDLDEQLDTAALGLHRIPGGGLDESQHVRGVAFAKTFSYAGFEQQPKLITDARIAVLNIELELKSESTAAELQLRDPAEFQRVVDAEWRLIYDKLERLVASGARVVLSRLPIGDLATQYFAQRKIFCAGRVPMADLERVAQATGAQVLSTVSELPPAPEAWDAGRFPPAGNPLGYCARFEERQVGAQRINYFTGCRLPSAATLLLRGGTDQLLAETERSVVDAIGVVRRTLQHPDLVPGAGAVEMALAAHLAAAGDARADIHQHIFRAVARALESIPYQLLANAGHDVTPIMSALRAKHRVAAAAAATDPATAARPVWGVNLASPGVLDALAAHIWEPAIIKHNAIKSAFEAAAVILSVDETVRAKPHDPHALQGRAPGGAQRAFGA